MIVLSIWRGASESGDGWYRAGGPSALVTVVALLQHKVKYLRYFIVKFDTFRISTRLTHRVPLQNALL